MDERRHCRRFEVCVPVRIDAQDRAARLGFTRDASAQGLAFGAPSRFEVGEQVQIRFAIGLPSETVVPARVIRVDKSRSGNHLWRYVAAVAFEARVPGLIESLLDGEEATARD